MYMKLLEQTVRELKGEELEPDTRANVNLHIDVRIDESYVADMNQRLSLYRRIAAARRDAEIDRVLEEASDRYGSLPESMLNLADFGRIRVMADRLDIESVDREGRIVVIKFRPQARVDPARLVTLVRQRPGVTLIPPGGLRLDLNLAGGSGPSTDKRVDVSRSPGPSPSRPPAGGAQRKAPRSPAPAPSWWTARARSGEVTPGFTKAEILKPAKDDPRRPGGVFEQVGGLLSDLLDQG